MGKKCKYCGVPLDGFFAKIAAWAGVKPSAKDPDCCNKCEDKIGKEVPVPSPEASAPAGEMPVVDMPPMAPPSAPAPMVPPVEPAPMPEPPSNEPPAPPSQPPMGQ